jgi:hypothetical protein
VVEETDGPSSYGIEPGVLGVSGVLLFKRANQFEEQFPVQ